MLQGKECRKLHPIILGRICCTETGFGSDLVLETIHWLSETFLKPELVLLFVLLKPKPVFKTIETTSRCGSVGFVCQNIGAVRNKMAASEWYLLLKLRINVNNKTEQAQAVQKVAQLLKIVLFSLIKCQKLFFFFVVVFVRVFTMTPYKPQYIITMSFLCQSDILFSFQRIDWIVENWNCPFLKSLKLVSVFVKLFSVSETDETEAETGFCTTNTLLNGFQDIAI